MNKKLVSFILAAGMAAFVLAGCGDTKTTDEDVIASEENTEEAQEDTAENTEDAQEDAAENAEADAEENAEEIIASYSISVQATGFDNALLLVTQSDGEGGTYVEETGSYGWIGEEGMTIGQLMEECDIVSLEAVCEGQEFLGWVAHEQVTEVDENGFEEYNTVKLFDGKVFTTEEMMAQELPAKNVSFYTVWDLVCGGCEERKVCEVFYIDDGVYYVCDDCYEEFAHGMGLE